MTKLLAVLRTVSALLLLAGLLRALLPQGRWERAFRRIIALFFLYHLLTPFQEGFWDFDSFWENLIPDTSAAQEEQTAQMATVLFGFTEDSVREELSALLRQQQIAAKVTVAVHKSAEGGIQIEQIRIRILDDTPKETVVQFVESWTGITPSVS